MRHIADDCLSAPVHRDVLDPDGLIASAPVSFERLYLRRERPGELVESAFRAVLLRDIFHIGEPTREFHRRHMNSGHLRGKLWSFGFAPFTTDSMKLSSRSSTFQRRVPASAS